MSAGKRPELTRGKAVVEPHTLLQLTQQKKRRLKSTAAGGSAAGAEQRRRQLSS
jgi:hypothetical protein